MEVRLARAAPSRLGLVRREHGRKLDGHLLQVVRMRFLRVYVGRSAPDFRHGLTLLDPSLTLTRTQYPAIVGNTGNKKPYSYAGFARLWNAQ
jgi:hypothetical protein